MDPHGPVYHYSFYMIYTLFLHCFYVILDGFIHAFLDFSQNLKTDFTFFITFLENSKDHFCSPPAPKFALKCKIKFPILLNLPENLLFLIS